MERNDIGKKQSKFKISLQKPKIISKKKGLALKKEAKKNPKRKPSKKRVV